MPKIEVTDDVVKGLEKLGVKVEVEEVDIPNREINFLLIEKLKVS